MPEIGALLIMVVIASLAFDYINGFHDTANAIATVVSTRVLSPAQAIIMAAALNFVGALVAQEVAKTIASGIIQTNQATQTVVLSAVIGGIVWNLITWKFGIPSSSSHALIGGLVGAGLAHGGPEVLKDTKLVEKVVIPLFASPAAGFMMGFLLMKLITVLFANAKRYKTAKGFHYMQIASSALMAYSHGQNDAQKSMGIITLALVANGTLSKPEVPLWVKISCAVVMALGTSAGGWRIMRTMGHKIIRLEPVNGFAAETAGASVIMTASHFGMPISTTHAIAGSIFGVGASKRLSAVRWKVALSMVSAWVTTIPAAMAVGASAYFLLRLLGIQA
ncbi:MAG TPA: inorganic phosphate transporter [Fimbriimonas sp.]|nr:inorganic phosphate transporter [Fimbriimonas sp.]